MTRGIYAYIDKETNKIVYVGKDSYIHEGRRKQQHLSPYKYDQQPFNKILQNNPDRYIYKVLEEGDFSDDMLDALEKNIFDSTILIDHALVMVGILLLVVMVHSDIDIL